MLGNLRKRQKRQNSKRKKLNGIYRIKRKSSASGCMTSKSKSLKTACSLKKRSSLNRICTTDPLSRQGVKPCSIQCLTNFIQRLQRLKTKTQALKRHTKRSKRRKALHGTASERQNTLTVREKRCRTKKLHA